MLRPLGCSSYRTSLRTGLRETPPKAAQSKQSSRRSSSFDKSKTFFATKGEPLPSRASPVPPPVLRSTSKSSRKENKIPCLSLPRAAPPPLGSYCKPRPPSILLPGRRPSSRRRRPMTIRPDISAGLPPTGPPCKPGPSPPSRGSLCKPPPTLTGSYCKLVPHPTAIPGRRPHPEPQAQHFTLPRLLTAASPQTAAELSPASWKTNSQKTSSVAVFIEGSLLVPPSAANIAVIPSAGTLWP